MAALTAKQVTVRGNPMWMVDLPASRVGKRQRIFRDTEEHAIAAAKEAINEHNKFGGTLKQITLEEASLLHEWRDKLTVAEMRQAFSAWYGKRDGERTVAKAVKEFINAPRDTPISRPHLVDLRTRLAKFAEAFPKRPIESLSSGEINTFIQERGGSARNFCKVIRNLFNHAELHEWVGINPMRKIKTPEPPVRIKDVLTPSRMHKALRICAGGEKGVLLDSGEKDIVGVYMPLLCELVFGGLCGLRASEVKRLRWEDIDLKAGKLGEIHVREMKTARRGIPERFVALSKQSRAWVDWMKAQDGTATTGAVRGANDQNTGKHRRRMLKALKLTVWPHNVLRRSYGSYHLAAYENAALTAELMGHTDATTTKAKYRVARRKEVALKWFALTPTLVLSTEAPKEDA